MPEFVEPLVAELVESFCSSTETDRHQMLSMLPSELRHVLGWYARKLAGRAVRNRSRVDLWNGLVSIAISADKDDARDVMAPLSLLYNSAFLLQEDPKQIFEMASKTSTQQVIALFASFMAKPVDQKSIGVFGFSEGVGPVGFDYVPLLPEYGGPTPF